MGRRDDADREKQQIRGAVIAGGIRDTKQILKQDFPVFYKYRTSNEAWDVA